MILTKFPMPPSSNKLYASVRGRLIKSVEGRKYDAAIERYALINFRQIEKVKAEMASLGGLFHIETKFVFMKNRIIGQKGQIKRLDASNRIKQVHDNLAKILGVDDCLFVQGSFSKMTCELENQEQVIITISQGQIVSF